MYQYVDDHASLLQVRYSSPTGAVLVDYQLYALVLVLLLVCFYGFCVFSVNDAIFCLENVSYHVASSLISKRASFETVDTSQETAQPPTKSHTRVA